MTAISFNSVLIIAGVAVLVPVLLGMMPRLPVPGAVLEVVAGILIGPSVLGWVRVDAPVQVLSDLGLGMLLFLLVRGLPAVLYRRRTGTRRAEAAGLLQATTLTFVIVATQIGLATGKISPTSAASLLAAGLLSAALFPAGALRLLSRRAEPAAEPAEETT